MLHRDSLRLYPCATLPPCFQKMSLKKNRSDVLVVEDDEDYREALCDMLALEGYSADGVGTVQAYSALSDKESYKLVLLDRNLPDGDGMSILKTHRKISATPVIFITCEGQLEDRVAGLNADADYYLIKPIKTDELLAIVQRCIRRQQGNSSPNRWNLDVKKWALKDPIGNEISLTHTETLLLSVFANKSGVAVSRDEIIFALGKNPDNYDWRRLEVAVRRLRNKAKFEIASKFPLETAYGIGYAFNADLKIQAHSA